jgi:hypothetical protein
MSFKKDLLGLVLIPAELILSLRWADYQSHWWIFQQSPTHSTPQIEVASVIATDGKDREKRRHLWLNR